MFSLKKIPSIAIGTEVLFQAQYRAYYAVVLALNLATRRATICMWDDVLKGGCWNVVTVDFDRLSPYNDKAAKAVAVAA